MLLYPTSENVKQQCKEIGCINNIKTFREYLENNCLRNRVSDIRCETGETYYAVISDVTYDFSIPGVEVAIIPIKILSVIYNKVHLDNGICKYVAFVKTDKSDEGLILEAMLFKSRVSAETLAEKIKELGPLAYVTITDVIENISNGISDKTDNKYNFIIERNPTMNENNEMRKILKDLYINVNKNDIKISKNYSILHKEGIPIIRIIEVNIEDYSDKKYKESSIYLTSPDTIINSYGNSYNYSMDLNIKYDNPDLNVREIFSSIRKKLEGMRVENDFYDDSLLTTPMIPKVLPYAKYMTVRSFFANKKQTIIYKLYGYGISQIDSVCNVIDLSKWIIKNFK